MKASDADQLVITALGIKPEKIPALMGRKRKLSKEGLLPHLNVGTGKQASYNIDDCRIIATALQMNIAGISPTVTVEAIRDNKAQILKSSEMDGQLTIHLPSEFQGGHPVTVLLPVFQFQQPA